MSSKLPRYRSPSSLLFGALCLVQAAGALATRGEIGIEGVRRDSQAVVRSDAGARSAPLVLATQSLDAQPRSAGSAHSSVAKASAGSPGREASANVAGGRGSKPVYTALATGPARPGYVHYFLLTLPDESLETLVGIEMPNRKIAWSFPELGVVVAPLVEKSVVLAGGKQYSFTRLYGIRPFPDEAAMNALRGKLTGRVERWVAAGTPYCDNDGPRSACMSCLGFVLRVLFPGGETGFPDLPKDFWRALYEKSYSTEDLLLYLTGMLDLPNREARLKRAGQLDLPDALRTDVLELVDAMDAAGAVPPAGIGTSRPLGAQKRAAARPTDTGSRPAQRKRL